MNDKINELYKKLQFHKEMGNNGMVNIVESRIEKLEAKQTYLEEQKYRQL